MRALLIPALVILLDGSLAHAHCFSQWRYPYPQKCMAYAQAAPMKPKEDAEGRAAARVKRAKQPANQRKWEPPAELPDIPVVLPPVAPEEDDRDTALALLRTKLAGH